MVIRSPQDIHDIIKVSSTEVAMNVKDEDERKRQARGVIDTILNRIYLEPGNNVRKVLNAKNQFSAISGKNGDYGSVQKMPDSKIKPWVAAYIEEYLIERTQNPNSSIGGNVNYLNPDPSVDVSKKNMEQWGNDVVAQAEASGLIFGEGKHKHYHGTIPGSKKAPKFIIVMPKDYKHYKQKWSK